MLNLGKALEESPASPTDAPAARAGGRGQKIWAVLLVLDSFFVIIFGGALAAKLYQHWQAPPPIRVVPRREPPAKPVSPLAAPAPAPKLASAPATISLPKAAPVKKLNGPAPKPSLLNDAPRHQAAAPQESASAAASAPASGKPKAQPVEFHYKGGGRKVELAGAFIVHGSGRKAMFQRDGTWSLTVYLTPNTYRYWFVVDGKKVLDPANSEKSRNASVLTVSTPQ